MSILETHHNVAMSNNQNGINNNSINKLSNVTNYQQKSKCMNKACIDYAVQMEHSYSRDCRPVEGINGLITRTLMVHKPPQCPSCHAHPIDEGLDLDESNHPPIPPYNEKAAKDAMDECIKIAKNVHNTNPDEEWEERVPKIGWTPAQELLFSKITRILDIDNLARLATVGRQHEPVHRRVIIDRSVSRFRQVFASISWDTRLTQWLHSVLMEYLPPTYMAIYLDILQTLKTKLPTLMDKMLFGKPMNINQELLIPVMKKQWEPIVSQKQRKLPSNAIILIVPSTSIVNGMSSRMQKWCQLFTTIAQVSQVQIPNANTLSKQPINQICEQLVHLSRLKVQELRREQPNSHIVLVGFNAGAALALQVSLTENVNSIVCMGFAYNTINGVRGTPDDHILEITAPIIFIIGQNSARTSQEEMEALREKMQSESSLVVVGSADDVLRVPKSKRQIEGVTQTMVDSMVMDEIFEFIKNCIVNPPGPRQINTINTSAVQVALSQARKLSTNPTFSMSSGNNVYIRKRKINQNLDTEQPTKMKYTKSSTLIGRPRTRPLPNITASVINQSKPRHMVAQSPSEALNIAIQSILPETTGKPSPNVDHESEDDSHILSALELLTQSPKKEIKTSPVVISTGKQQQQSIRTIHTSTPTTHQKIKMIPTNQFIHVKPPTQQNTQNIYAIKTSPILSSATNNQSIINTNQVFTVKTASNSQVVPTSSNSSTANTIILNSPSKFTVYKTSANLLNSQGNISGGKSATDLSSTDILDLPIIFADNEGNIHENASAVVASTSSSNIFSTLTSSASSSTPNTIILNQQQQKQLPTTLNQSSSGKLILNTTNSGIQKAKSNKVVYINRNTMKPCTNVSISNNIHQPTLKYTKLVMANPNSGPPRLVTKTLAPRDIEKGITTITIQKPKPLDISEIGSPMAGNIVKTISGTSRILANSAKQSPQTGIISTGNKQFQPIFINMDSDKSTIKNMIKVGGNTITNVNNADLSNIKPTIVLKSGGLKALSMTGLKPGILNRNLTVRKVVNILPTKTGATISQPANNVSPSNLSTIAATTVATITTTATNFSRSSDNNQPIAQLTSSTQQDEYQSEHEESQ